MMTIQGKFPSNLPLWERIVRVVAGVTLGLLCYDIAEAWLRWPVLGVAGAAVFTGLTGFCPTCAVIGRRFPFLR
ncbi:YgaP family membrane protein [Chitinimonas lacunae]|uniref:DUF2892 domain-containing protein n=1 Tax=Chitinimonas lacunae TaxID=1963018 RepID=A0ABV8MMS8_9NEIS